jgi:CRISPR type IV-associated protein Csf3
VYCCSDPIISGNADEWEWQERISKHIDASLIALLLAPEERKVLSVKSGHYKALYRPVRIRLINQICWFVRGDKGEINRLLKSVIGVGLHRNIGYGLIAEWEYEETEKDYSVFADFEGEKILMKTVPFGRDLSGVSGYKRSFGGAFPPYWHPETCMEIAIPY